MSSTVRSFILFFTLSLNLNIAVAKVPKVAVMVFNENKTQEGEGLRVRVEKDLRAMFQYAHEQGKSVGSVKTVETYFDVGKLSKANLETAKRHFNEALRAIEKNDYQEAKDQLFRAKRFYRKGVPFVSDSELLQAIYYAEYLTVKALSSVKQALPIYCSYISLSRNIAGAVGPIEQYDVLADLCGETPISGSAELIIKTNIDGAHVYINNQQVGIASKGNPHIEPFMPAGVHLVELRKSGNLRWGQILKLQNGESKSLKGKLKRAKNVSYFNKLDQLPIRGENAYSDVYLSEFLYLTAQDLQVDNLVFAYIYTNKAQEPKVTIITFQEGAPTRFESSISYEQEGYRGTLASYWKTTFKNQLNVEDAQPSQNKWMPTFFKVE